MTREELEDELAVALSFCSEDVGEQAQAALSVFEKYVCTDAGEPEADGRPVWQLDKEKST